MKKNIIKTILSIVPAGIVVLVASQAFADTMSIDKVSLTIPSSCTLVSNVNSEHSFTTFGGTYKQDIGQTTIKIICNDGNGFSIYAKGFSGDNAGDTNLINSANRANDIVTGTATSGNVSNWAMKATKVAGNYPLTMNDNYDGVYNVVPSEWTRIAYRESSTDVAAGVNSEGSSLTTTYAAYITPAQPTGNYQGQVKYVMIHPASTSVSFTIHNLDHMQDFASLSSSEKASVIDSMEINEQYTLKDSRDNKKYYIAKLADGNVWMTQNLDHDIVTTPNFYTPENTDIPANWTAQIATYATNNSTWESYYYIAESYDPGDLCWNGLVREAAEFISCDDPSADKHLSLGNYYTWSAAVASNNSRPWVTDGADADQSICPAGWTLPIGNPSTGESAYGTLFNAYSASRWGFPLYFTLPGYHYNNGVTNNLGYAGYYWSRISKTQNHAYEMDLYASEYFSPLDNGVRGSGDSIRCVLR